MSKTKIINPDENEFVMMMRREWITSTGAYETVSSTNSSMDDQSANVMEYRSYLFSTSVVFILRVGLFLYLVVIKNINMVHWMWWILTFSHHLKILSHTSQIKDYSWKYLQYDLVLEVFFRETNHFVSYCLYVSDLIEYIFFLNILYSIKSETYRQ